MTSTVVSPWLALFSILIVFLFALLGALLPLHVLTTSTGSTTLFRYGNAFAAGFLSAAAFVHLLPGADRAFMHLFPDSKYPTAGLLALAGATAVFSLDHVLRHRFSRTAAPDAGGHVQHCHTHPTSGSPCHASLVQQQKQEEEEEEDHKHHHDEEQPLLPSSSSSVHPSQKTRASTSPALPYVLAAALSLHSLVEGLTLGASILRSARFVAILAAIVAHKTFAAMSLGTSLTTIVTNSPGSRAARNAAMATAFGFAALTPVGALIGVAAVTNWLNSRNASIVSAGLNSLSAGIFVYVAFVEMLAEDFRCGEEGEPHGGGKRDNEQEDDAVQRALVFVASAAAMSLLAIWT